jgi:hypothetical protein
MSTNGNRLSRRQHVRDTVDAAAWLGDFSLFANDLKKSIRRAHSVTRGDEPTLPFDVTQEIGAALVDELRQGSEPTLIETDFDEIHSRV